MELQKRLMNACEVFQVERAIEITLLAMAGEALESIGYIMDATKPWKQPKFDIDATREEVIDIYHFYLQLLVLTDNYKYVFVDYNRDFDVFNAKPNALYEFENACKTTAEYSAELSRWQDDDELATFLVLQWHRMRTMFQVLEMSPEDVDALYKSKNAKNFARIEAKLNGIQCP
jgi:hypothetical protein